MILHGIGSTFKGALEQCALATFNVFTPLEGIENRAKREVEVTVEGTDKKDLIYTVLDELLFIFCTEFFVAKNADITEMTVGDDDSVLVKLVLYGETFVLGKHEQGTEIKAITMHNMSFTEEPDETHIYVTVDI